MSDTQKHTKPNVPNLRFPGFSGEWEESTFGDCCTGFDYGMNAASKQFDGKHKYIRITDIDENTSEYRGDGVVSPDTEIDEHYRVKENDILFARTGASTGKTYLYDPKDGRLYYAGFLIRMNVSPRNDSRFVFYQTQTPRYKKWVQIMSMRSGQPGINSQEYSSYRCFLPKLEEQQKIAKLLTIIDQRISIQNKVIEKYESLIKALYRRLLPLVVDKTAELGTLVHICKGKQLNGEFLSDEGKYYVMNGGITPSGYYDEYNTPAGTISISEGGNSCGFVQYNEKPFWSGGHCYTLLQTTDERIQYKFLYHFLKSKQDEIMALRIGSGLPNIQKKNIGSFPVPILPIDYQNAITRLLDAIGKYIKNEQAILVEITHQKSYFLGNLFI